MSAPNFVTTQPSTYSASRSLANRSEAPAAGLSTPLRPLKGQHGYEYPAIWSFPPFFTIQPNPQTQAHQLSLWSTLILSWARYTRVWEMNAEAKEGDLGEVFWNKSIRRKLPAPGIKQVLQHMAKEGNAVADPPKQSSTYLLYWRKPEEWGTIIYDWITENGLTGSIMTFYEITNGDLSFTADFRDMPPALLKRSLETLVKRGKAQLLRGEGETGEGVRFL